MSVCKRGERLEYSGVLLAVREGVKRQWVAAGGKTVATKGLVLVGPHLRR